MAAIKDKALKGLAWSFIDNFSKQIFGFVIGIILARLLSPSEFGIIGIIMVIIAICQTFIDSGFALALIRKDECEDIDYSTVFIFNLLFSVVLYFVLFLISPFISDFFDEPKLSVLIQVSGLAIVLGSFSIIQRVRLTRELNFKLQTQVTLGATLVSGAIGIGMAYLGYGVWSLVARILVEILMTSLLLIIFNRWMPSLNFSSSVFKSLFAFSNNLLVSSLINTLYKNVYFVVIGKYFSTATLGYYTRAEQFQKLTTQNLSSVIQRVSFPLLSTMKNDIPQLTRAFKSLVTRSMFVSFILTLGLAAISEAMVYTFIGEKWEQSILYIQIICFSGMLYPTNVINLNLLNVMGYSSRFLRLEVFKKILIVPVIIFGVFNGMTSLLIGMVCISFISFYINAYYTKSIINYAFKEQVWDILKSFLLAFGVSAIVFLVGKILPFSFAVILVLQMVLDVVLIVVFSEILNVKEYLWIKEYLIKQVKTRLGKNRSN